MLDNLICKLCLRMKITHHLKSKEAFIKLLLLFLVLSYANKD